MDARREYTFRRSWCRAFPFDARLWPPAGLQDHPRNRVDRAHAKSGKDGVKNVKKVDRHCLAIIAIHAHAHPQ